MLNIPGRPLRAPIFRSFRCALALLAAGPVLAQDAAAPMDYDSWRKAHPEDFFIHLGSGSSQSGQKELEPAIDFRGEWANGGTGDFLLETRAASNSKLRTRIRAAWRGLLGPSVRNAGPLEAKALEEKDFPSYVRKKVEYAGDPGEPIRAWLFLPKGRTGRGPAMLCLHQTFQSGKDEAAGIEGKPELAFGPLLAERGYVTLCPDVIGFGERYRPGGSFFCHYGDYARLSAAAPGRSILAKMADDTMRAVDYLASLPEVDPARIGSIGHSHGGYGTLFAMAFDERIAAGVVSCGFTCFRSDNLPGRWYRRTALMPRLGAFDGRIEESPVDFHHLMAACSPRPLFLSIALKDEIFPKVGDVGWIEKDVRAVYAREEAKDRFEVYAFDADHDFTPEARDRAWGFLDRHLKAGKD